MKYKKHFTRIVISFLIALLFTLAEHYKIIPNGKIIGSYNSKLEFAIGLTIQWIIFLAISYAGFRNVEVICSKCESVQNIKKKELGTKKCAQCDIPLIKLEGFYDKKNL